MDSNESNTKLKHFGFLKEIAVKLIVLLSNVYDFAKENSGVPKTTIVSAENVIVLVVRPVYEILKYLLEEILVFVDNKFDKYAPEFAITLVAEMESFVAKTTPLVHKLLVTVLSIITPLIAAAIFLHQKVLETTIYLLQKVLETTIYLQKLVSAIISALLQKGLATSQSVSAPQSTPLVDAAQSLLQNSLDATTSLLQDPILQKGPDLANKALDTTKSVIGGIPLVGNVAHSLDATTSLLQDPILQKGPDLANKALDTTKSVIGGIPLVGNVAHGLDATTSLLQPIDLANKALDTTKSVMGGIPLVGNVAQSLIPNPTYLVNRMVVTPSSLLSKNLVLDAVNSTAQSFIQTSQETATKATIQSAYMSFKLVAIPVIVEFWYKVNTYPLLHIVSEAFLPLVEIFCQLYNKLLKYMDTNGYSLSGYLPSIPIDETKTSYNLVKTTMDSLPPEAQEAATKAKLQSAYMTFKVAGIPVIAELWYKVNTYPLVNKLSKVFLPVAEHLCQLYNKLLEYLDKKGYSLSGYLPPVPIEEMKNAYKLVKTRMDVLSAVGNVLG